MNSTIVVTSINPPNDVMRSLAAGAQKAKFDFLVIGDTKSPENFILDGCRYLDLGAQISTGLRFANACPTGHYARKNIGFLLAIANGAELVVETDDDNFPRDSFFANRVRHIHAPVSSDAGWLNVYRYFSEALIWPRGFPLDHVRSEPAAYEGLAAADVDCPIQQGLADMNPDVDAIYRLLLPLPQSFCTDRRLALGSGSWCPFNSQNTTWWADAFPLLYLPSHCSFRMTDIWRSFVAQRIAWANGWCILFHEPTVWQERNEHDLMRDFADEVPGYLNNERIVRTLEDLPLGGTPGSMAQDLRRCYGALVDIGVIGAAELSLLDAWLADLETVAAAGNR